MSPITAAIANKIARRRGLDDRWVFQVSNPGRISVGGFCGYGEVVNTPDDGGGDTEEGSEIKGGIGKSPFGSDVGFCSRAVVLVEWCILYLGIPFAGVVAGGGVGIGTDVAVRDVSVEPEKVDGTMIADRERGSNPGFLAFALNWHPPAL